MITVRERITLAEVLRGSLAQGRPALIDHFRDVLPLDQRHCLFTNQGKAAFEQIVLTANLQRSRILMPAFFPDDFVGIFHKYEMTPVFVDVEPRRYHLNLDAVKATCLDGVKAMIVLHTFGLPADGRRYREFCDEHGLVMIEDCARALGASTAGALVGSFGHYALFSLSKCAPVREGGVALSEIPFQPQLKRAKLGLFGLLHALTLVKYPLMYLLEYPVYALVAGTPVYPREVGNYDPLPARQLDAVGRSVLKWYMPHYRDAIAKKRACAGKLREALDPCGFTFQADGGDHICTAVSAEPPADCDVDDLKVFLRRHGVKTSAMWRDALGVSPFAQQRWDANPEAYPVTMRLAKRQLQLPVSRFQTPGQTQHIVDVCKRFVETRL